MGRDRSPAARTEGRSPPEAEPPTPREVVAEAGQERLQGALPAGEQDMDVLPLRDTGAVHGDGRQAVPLEDDDLLKVLRKRSRTRQPGHSRANNDGSFSDRCHRLNLNGNVKVNVDDTLGERSRVSKGGSRDRQRASAPYFRRLKAGALFA